LPELHGVCPDPKPEPYKINVSAEEFEKLIYIWEFCNNFNDYLDTPTFKLEELKCALSYSEQDDANLMDEMEIDWNEQMRLKHIREKGLHMINCLHTALVTCFLDDLFPENKSDEPAHATNTRAAVAQQ
jgi:DDT domain